jgi:hypothetical protein
MKSPYCLSLYPSVSAHLSVYLPNFWGSWGLWDNLAVCLSHLIFVRKLTRWPCCVSVSPHLIFWFPMRSVPYRRKVGDWFLQKLILYLLCILKNYYKQYYTVSIVNRLGAGRWNSSLWRIKGNKFPPTPTRPPCQHYKFIFWNTAQNLTSGLHYLKIKKAQRRKSSWKNSLSASQEIIRHLWNLKFHYRVHKSSLLDPIMSQINSVLNYASYSLNIRFSIIL